MIITYIVRVPNRAPRTTSSLLRSWAISLKAKWDILYPVTLKFTDSLGDRRTKPSRQELDAGFHENWVKAFPLLLICFDGYLAMSRMINLESGFLTSLKQPLFKYDRNGSPARRVLLNLSRYFMISDESSFSYRHAQTDTCNNTKGIPRNFSNLSRKWSYSYRYLDEVDRFHFQF